MGRAFGTVAVGSTVLAVGLALIYWLARYGFSNPPWPILRALGLAVLLINAPYAIRMLIRRRTLEYGWASSYSFVWLMTLVVTALLGWAMPVAGPFVFVPLAVIATLAFIVLLFDWASHSGWKTTVGLMGASALFATWTGGVVWGRIYKSPLFLEMLMLDGKIHHDGMTLAALGNMIRTYHVPSVGLDGLPYMAYHWGTPWLFAQWSNLTGLSLTEFYQLAYPITMIPLFFGGVVAFAMEARHALYQRRLASMRAAYDGESDWFDPGLGRRFWLIFIAATIGFVPITGMEAMGVWTSNYMISESYGVAIPVALLLLGTAIVFWQADGAKIIREPGTAWDYAFLGIVLPAGIIALGFLKISLMILAFAAVAYAAIRVGAMRRWPLALILLMTTVLVGLTYTQVSLVAHHEGVAPLDFLKLYIPLEWWPFFFLAHLFWSLVYIVLRLRQEAARTLGDLAALVNAGKILDVEVVGVIAIIGVLPGLILHIDGGSAFYFSDVQRWLSVGLLLAGARSLLPQINRPRWSNLPTIALALVLIPLALATGRNSVYWTKRMLAGNIATRLALYPAVDRASVGGGATSIERLLDPTKLGDGLRATRNYNPVQGLLSLDAIPLSQKRRTAVFIPQTEDRYWGILGRPGACAFSGFLLPSLTGMAMIDGMPAAQCALSPYYGLSLFAKRTAAQAADATTPLSVCGKARAKGFSRVIVVRFDSNGKIQKEPVTCPTK